MIYNITDTPKTIKEWFLYALQQVLAVFVATVLIANICRTPVDACLIGGCCGTLLYQLITGFRSPMFISSCGATCSAVIGALAIGGGGNYVAVFMGGIVILLIYALFAGLIKWRGVDIIFKIFPPVIVGPVTMVIGLNLAAYIPTYVQINGAYSSIGVLVAIFTMIVIALCSQYFKGFLKTIPFLIGLLAGYIVCVILTLCGIPVINFSLFKNMSLFNMPDFSFIHWSASQFSWGTAGQVILLFLPVAICAILEHISDHNVLSNIIKTNLLVEPGLDRTLLGDGAASLLGTILCGLPNTSYGESIATTGFSKVCSVKVISLAAIMLGLLAFITPVQVFIASIPSCVFGGCAMVLYGYIAISGLKTIVQHKVDLDDNKNLLILCVILTVGVSGTYLFHAAFTGVSLAMVLGVILNLILREPKVE